MNPYNQNQAYAPPQGPPPSRQNAGSSSAPPPFPPPQYSDPPPNEAWRVIPDTSLLPPPPTITYNASPTSNANTSAADAAHAWTDANSLWPPRPPNEHDSAAVGIGFSSLIPPVELRQFGGKIESSKSRKIGRWTIQTRKGQEDACLLSSVPLYSPWHHQTPLQASNATASGTTDKLAYFEVSILSLPKNPDNGTLALGFVAPPYPTWRQPGWERASLGVHGDDGRRFVNDTWGGRDFATPFKVGETIGLGMRFKLASSPKQDDSDAPPAYTTTEKASAYFQQQQHGPKANYDVEVFLTRNGKVDGTWDLHEEIDSSTDQPGGVNGLGGDRDLHAAIGVFGAVEVEACFGRSLWMWQGWR